MKKLTTLFLSCILLFAISMASDSTKVTTQCIAEKVMANPDKVLRVNNRYDEYIKSFKGITIYVAPKLYVAIKIIINDEKGLRTYFAADLGIDGTCDRMIKVPGSTTWYEDAGAHLDLLGSKDEKYLQTEIDLVDTERMVGDRPYLHRILFWRTDGDNWRVANFDTKEIGSTGSAAPQTLWESFIKYDVSPHF